MTAEDSSWKTRRRLPEWLKRPLPKGEKFRHVTEVLQRLNLNTVCSGASCPNRGECYSQGTATFMIMGDLCTRNCRFCAVNHGQASPLDEDEPQRLAQAVKELNLRHVVITSVTRDDLDDGGAEHFARTIGAVRSVAPEAAVEVLTPDFNVREQSLEVIRGAHPDVFNHNIETSRRLTPQIRSRAQYDSSLAVLNYMSGYSSDRPAVKSGFMLGLGETDEEIVEIMDDLRRAGVEILTIGQYLRPGKENIQVEKYYRPEEFDEIRKTAIRMGFSHVAAGPFVRSSYHAHLYLS